MTWREYEAVLLATNEASRAFRQVQEAYRAQKINDAEFLAARKVYQEQSAKFDVAFEAASRSPEIIERHGS